MKFVPEAAELVAAAVASTAEEKASASTARAAEADVALKKEAFLDTTLLVGSFCALLLLLLLLPLATEVVALVAVVCRTLDR